MDGTKCPIWKNTLVIFSSHIPLKQKRSQEGEINQKSHSLDHCSHSFDY
ncbi:MAG TPA: hypothetical protein VJ583_04630 [Nitrososphaeraceae archaeon]|nr:hypothetical protein [Nitrososphaeraceae archaeon]